MGTVRPLAEILRVRIGIDAVRFHPFHKRPLLSPRKLGHVLRTPGMLMIHCVFAHVFYVLMFCVLMLNY